jgi:hypothetical protein
MATSLNDINVHRANEAIAESVIDAARKRGWIVRRNQSSARTGHFDGYHRYVVLRNSPDRISHSIRSRHCVGYAEARFSREFLPSIRGERMALEQLLQQIA